MMASCRCECGRCLPMPEAVECNCCMESENVVAKLEGSGARCITQHEGFDAVCLNQYVLEVAYYQYRQQHGEHRPVARGGSGGSDEPPFYC